ncbi:MAG: hypothetical protein KF706_02020 [Chitinophagales bacterium]|mgnify:CR=1 FL=1|nr:hypothetical protein [Chitinophagales bacterium]OJV26088.1 MAG: hypothetical protein BGO32_06805 [Bacteroidetes bacterium 37-13]HRN94870.1 hypothetical protein [Chitinophagales bacterium]HRP38406.1 hypothetical protein [Chitinophagales bacterium]
MDYSIVLTIFAITVPAALVLLTAYLVFKQQTKKELETKLLDLKLKDSREIKVLRLQAYERLAMFLERISPFSLVSRCIEADMISPELQYAMVKTIKAEFEHNLSQQIYVSDNCWNLIVQSKDETIKTINLIAAQVNADASAQELSRIIFTAVAGANAPLPTQHALDFLKAEVREIF